MAARCAARSEADGANRNKKVIRRSDSFPLDRFSVIERAWADETVLCIGGGPSVTPQAVAAARGKSRVIAVNDSYLLAPWADLLYFADHRWWEWHKAKPAFVAHAGIKVTIENTGMLIRDEAVHMLHNSGGELLSDAPNGIHTGSNGGYQAINIAYLAGAKRILLLGYDMKFPAGKSHWHGGHEIKVPESHYTGLYAVKFKTMLPQLKKAGVEVINCSIGSSIQCFPFAPLAEALP